MASPSSPASSKTSRSARASNNSSHDLNQHDRFPRPSRQPALRRGPRRPARARVGGRRAHRFSPSVSATARTPCTGARSRREYAERPGDPDASTPAPEFIPTKHNSADEAAYTKLNQLLASNRKSSPAAKSASTTSTTTRRAKCRRPSSAARWRSLPPTRSRSSSTAARPTTRTNAWDDTLDDDRIRVVAHRPRRHPALLHR